MRKNDLIEAVQERAELDSKAQSQRAVDAVFSIITESLSKGESVNVTGFGSFSVAKRSARDGVNPQTGEKIRIAATVVPKFKAGKGLKDAVK